MRGLIPYAWRSLVARRTRSLLTVFGVAIGVAVLVAALGVNAGLDASIDRTVASLIGRADLRVAAFAESGLSAATLQAIDDVPGIALTAPAIERRSYLAEEPGRTSAPNPVTVLGIDPTREPRVRDLTVARGSTLSSLDEDAALVTERLARDEGVGIGDELSIYGSDAPVRVRIVGILPGDGPAVGASGRTVVLPILTAATLAGTGGTTPALETLTGISRIDVVLAAGTDAATATDALGRAIVTEPYVLSAPQDIGASLRASTSDITATMAMLAAISLFAAAFLILNTLAMTVVERVRELGLLRAAGATRGQIVRIVLAQGLLLGIAGSLLGVVLGALLATVAASWLRASGTVALDGPSLTPAVLLTGAAAGLVITLIASLEPARRASSVSPVTALRARGDPGATARTHTSWLIAVIVGMGAFAILLLPAVVGSGGAMARMTAVYAILLGAVLLTPVLLGPVGRLAGLPFAVFMRLEERLARAAIARDRGRTTITVGTLVVGLAMFVALGSVAANARVVATAWLGEVVPGDEILTAIAPAPVGVDGFEADLAAIDGVRRVTPIASFDLAYQGTRLEATAVRGSDFNADGRLTFTAGDRDEALAAVDAGGAVILPSARAASLGVGVGDTIDVATAAGLATLKVAGLVERSFPGRTGETAIVGWADALDRFGVEGADAFVVRYDPGLEATARPEVDALAGQLALTAAPIEQIEGAVGDALDRVFGLLDMLALAAVVVAALGIVNTLSMDTWERIRELGMLRAAGMSRRQVWRSVLVEAGILGAVGALVGAVTGVILGVLLVVTASGDTSFGIVLPWASIVLALLLGVGLAMVAAAQPARLAGRRSIVSAVRGD